jgi:ATP-dependent helicase HrpB
MLLAARGPARNLAGQIAAVLSERDFVRTDSHSRDSDLEKRIDLLQGRQVAGLDVDRGALERIRKLSGIWTRELTEPETETNDIAVSTPDVGLLLANAYPDRIARRRGDTGRYLLASGRGAEFAGADALARSEFLVIASLDAGDREARIHLAATIGKDQILTHFGDSIIARDRIEWDKRESVVIARRQRCLGALVLEESALDLPPGGTIDAMLDGIRELGLGALPWTPAAISLRSRIGFLRQFASQDPTNRWPDLSDQALLERLDVWLAPYLEGMTRREHLARLDLVTILRSMLDYASQQTLELEAPTHLTVPSGSRIPIDYTTGTPTVAVRLQEMFGLATTPRVGGRTPVTLELLSPARRPVQVTRDLSSFWARGYLEVKKELKGRYPKHYWPDDPLVAEATARARPRR